MLNPLAGLEGKVDEIKAAVALAVEITIFRVLAKLVLSHLAAIEPAKAAAYQSFIETIG